MRLSGDIWSKLISTTFATVGLRPCGWLFLVLVGRITDLIGDK